MGYNNEIDAYIGSAVDSMKKVLYVRHTDIFKRLNFDNDEIFMEPLLYTYVTQNDNKWLDCIIYGYESNKKERIEVFSNSSGVIYLPNYGYLNTSIVKGNFELYTDSDRIRLFHEEKEVIYTFEPLLFINDNLELVKHQHPLLSKVFTDQESEEDEIITLGVYKDYENSLRSGLGILSHCNPDFFKNFGRVVRKIQLFISARQNSFAVMSAHNMIFLNVKNCFDSVFFIDHISHEGGHVLFNTITYDEKYELFKCPYNTPIGDFMNEPGKYGSVYTYFHGLFTFLEITKSLFHCLDQDMFTELQNHDIKGRFIFHVQRFKISIDMFEEFDILTNKGIAWLTLFKNHYNTLIEKFDELMGTYSLVEQPYDFDSKIFAKVNSLQ